MATISRIAKTPLCKRCEREPSVMGYETMYLVPWGIVYYVLCGGCVDKMLKMFGKKERVDFFNLFTNAEDYHEKTGKFLGLVK